MIYLFERFRQVEVLLGDFRQIELITVEVWLLELSLEQSPVVSTRHV